MLYLAMMLFALTLGAWVRYLDAPSYLADQAHTQFLWLLGLFVAALVIGLIRRR
ncbi:MAG TPA: hypothetical protein VM689_04065 [Aliidongia sp.]|nr:hypothetical protein [Aliidongia sp.]